MKTLIIFLIIIFLFILLYNIFKKIVEIQWIKKSNNTYRNRSKKGKKGEEKVSDQLLLLDQNEYKIYNNLLFSLKNDVTVQIDHLVVSCFGIFVIETKNYGGIVKQMANDVWKQIWYKSEFLFYSPLKQNESHIKSLMYVLFTKNRNWFKSFIVFPNSTSLSVFNNTPAIHCKWLCREIENYQKHILTVEEVERICEKIEERNIYSKRNIKKHRKRIKELYV